MFKNNILNNYRNADTNTLIEVLFVTPTEKFEISSIISLFNPSKAIEPTILEF